MKVMKKSFFILVVIALVAFVAISCKKTGTCFCYYPEGYEGIYIDYAPHNKTHKEYKALSRGLGFECKWEEY